MAIHIDIYAHLKKSQLIKEGEQLKKYVESLEKDANKRLEKGAEGRSSKLIRLNDAQAKSYDQLINASDSYVASLNREKDAENALKSLKKTKQRDIRDEEKHAKALAAAERAVTDAQKDRVYRAQQLTAAANTQTRAVRDLTQADAEHTKNARQVGALMTANSKRFDAMTAATNRQRREMESLHQANAAQVKDNKAIANGLDRVKTATAKTAKERKKYTEMVKEGTASYRELRAQSDRLVDAHNAEQKAIGKVRDGLKDVNLAHQQQRVVVDANRESLKGFAQQANQSNKQIKDLHRNNSALIDSNAKLTRSFNTARDATKAANREHQEYKRLAANGASQDVLRRKAEKVADAYAKQARDVRAARQALGESLGARNDSRSFIQSQSNAMQDYALNADAAARKIDDLHDRHARQIRDNASLSRAFDAVEASTRKASVAHQDYNRMVANGASADDLRRQAQKVSDAYDAQRHAADAATEAQTRNAKEERAAARRGRGDYVKKNIAGLTPLGRVDAGVGLPLLGLAGNFAEAGVTASQSLTLLPAIATSAAAAIGTLAIGMHGFIDTVGDMGDPKKFAEGLASLAPNAQQAALEIKALVDGPLGDLKRMVQDDLFANVAPQLDAVVSRFQPQMQALFGGLATEMNKAFIGITNVLMMPDVQTSLSNTVDSIVAGFQHLMPMLAPLTQAFVKITEVGSSFLPQLGDIFTNAATAFNSFIQQAASDGSLQNFIQKGIDATLTLINFVKELGVEIYQKFGNKSPQEFVASLLAAKDMITGILTAIQSLASAINTIAPIVTGITDAVGGAENATYLFIGLWAGVKLANALKWTLGMFGMQGIGGAISALVGTSDKAAGGITAAFAKIKIPPALLSILGKGGALAAGAFGGYEIAQSTNDSGWMNDAQMQNNGTGPLGLGDNSIVKWINRNTPDWMGGDHFDSEGRWIDSRTQGATDVPPGTATPTGSLFGDNGFPGAGTPGGWPAGTDPAGNPWDPKPLPSNAGKYEFANVPIGQFGGAQWQVPQGATDLPVDYDNLGKQGFYRPDPLKIMDKQGQVDNARQTAEEARSKYLDLVAAGNTRQEELNKASNDVVQAEQGYLRQMRDLKEAERGEFEDLTSQMDKFGTELKDSLGSMGAALDPDLGISKGLAGMADNLVRFVGSLALAPTIAGLKKQQYDEGFPDGKGAGMGLMGMLTAPWAKPTLDKNKERADAYRAQYGIQNYGLNTVTPQGAVPTDIGGSLANSLTAAGIDPAMFNVISGFSKTEGNNPSGVPTLGFTDSQAGTSLAGHADALAKQIGARASVTGPFPANGTPAQQAEWMATLVGQNGVSSDWQGNAQPARSDYVGRIVAAMGGGAQTPVPAGAGTPSAQNPAMSAWPGAAPGESARDFAHRARQPIFEKEGYTVGDHKADQYGEHQNGALDIMVPSIAEGQKVLQQVLSDPNTYGAIFNNQTYGYGHGTTPKDYSAGHTGDPSQDHTNHVHAWYKPGNKDNIIPLPGGMLPPGAADAVGPGMPGGGPLGSVPSGSGTPVFVTNWPGGGAFGGGGGGAPGAPGGAPAGDPMAVGPTTPHLGTGAPPGPTDVPAGANPSGNGPHITLPPRRGGPTAPTAAPANLPQWENAGGAANWISKALTGGPNKLPWDDLSRYGINASGAGRWLGNLLNTEDKNEFVGGGGSFAGQDPASLGSLLGVGDPGAAKPSATDDILRAITGNSAESGIIGPGLTPAINPAILNPAKLPGFAKGGEVPIMAHSGEHVLTTKDVAAMGGHQGVLDFRNSLQHFEGGGAVNDLLIGDGGKGVSGNSKSKSLIGGGGAGPAAKGLGIGGAGTGPTAVPKPGAPMIGAGQGLGPNTPPPPGSPLVGPAAVPAVAPPAAPAAPTPVGAQVNPNTGIGDGMKADLGMLAGAASMFPGGALAQTGIKLAERGIEYAGQVASIGVQGLMETFLPTGGSELANNNWITRIAGAVAGSAPAISNMAGGQSNPEGGPGGGLPPGPMGIPGIGPATPEQIAAQSMTPAATAAAPASSSVTNFNYTANGVKGAEEAFPDAARAWEARPGQR